MDSDEEIEIEEIEIGERLVPESDENGKNRRFSV